MNLIPQQTRPALRTLRFHSVAFRATRFEEFPSGGERIRILLKWIRFCARFRRNFLNRRGGDDAAPHDRGLEVGAAYHANRRRQLGALRARGGAPRRDVDYDAGHGGIGATVSQQAESFADTLSFALWQTGDPDFQPSKK